MQIVFKLNFQYDFVFFRIYFVLFQQRIQFLIRTYFGFPMFLSGKAVVHKRFPPSWCNTKKKKIIIFIVYTKTQKLTEILKR